MLYMTREERYISLDHMPNTRDLGGYETQDGHYTKAHHFVRASGPYECSDHDLDKLYDYGVRVTIDLRSDFEKKAMASRFSEDDRFENIEIKFFTNRIKLHITINNPIRKFIIKDILLRLRHIFPVSNGGNSCVRRASEIVNKDR